MGKRMKSSRNIKRTLFVLGLVLILGIFGTKGTASAQEVDLALMIGSLVQETPFGSLVRLEGGEVIVSRNGQEERLRVVNGLLTTTISMTETTVLTFLPSVGPPVFPGRRFQLTFDLEGNLVALDLDDRDPATGLFQQLGWGRGADGSYHFEIFKDGLFVFTQADPLAPIMSLTKDWRYGEFMIGPGLTSWSVEQPQPRRLFRAWGYAPGPRGEVPDLVLRWIHPDGTVEVFRYPAGGFEDDGRTRWISDVIVAGPDNLSSVVWRLQIEYLEEFLRGLIDGTNILVFHLENPVTGEMSNIRVEHIIVDLVPDV